MRTGTGIFDTERGFTGQIRDALTGLNFYNARYQDPVLGRFVSPDSIVPNPANPGLFNRFTYVLNNPLRYTDPTGRSCEGNSVDDPWVCGQSRESRYGHATNNPWVGGGLVKNPQISEAGNIITPWILSAAAAIYYGIEKSGEAQRRQSEAAQGVAEDVLGTLRDNAAIPRADLFDNSFDNSVKQILDLAQDNRPDSGVTVITDTVGSPRLGAQIGRFVAVDSDGLVITGQVSAPDVTGPVVRVPRINTRNIVNLATERNSVVDLIQGPSQQYGIYAGSYSSPDTLGGFIFFDVSILGAVR